MMEIGQLVVRFERDWEPRHYPYLGQISLMGAADQLVAGYDCKRVVEFSPMFGSPAAQLALCEVLNGDGDAPERLEALGSSTPAPFWCLASAGWRTFRSAQAALESGGGKAAGLLDIIGPLSQEVDELVDLMNAAVDADIRFQVDMDTCDDPPEQLVRFVQRDFEEIASIIRQSLEEAGIEITEGGTDEDA
jgi:hypothetical protein